jgi:hypothetical protein
MSAGARYFFTKHETNQKVAIFGCLEDDQGNIGDSLCEIGPGQSYVNLTYEELAAAGGGRLLATREGLFENR